MSDSTSVDTGNTPEWERPCDLAPTWEARRSTTLLFGEYVRDSRRSHELTVEVLAHAADRTQEWLRSLERGEFIPTREMIDDLDLGFARATGAQLALDEIYLDLLGDPHSDLADALRSRLGGVDPSGFDLEDDAPAPAGAVPVGAALSFADRVLVVSPAAVGLMIAVGVGLVFQWAAGRSVPDFVDVSTMTFVGVALLACTAFLLPTLNAVFRPLASLVRLPNRTKASDIDHWAEVYGVPATKSSTWHQPGFSVHLQPRYRGAAAEVGLAADFAERMTCVFALSAVLTALGCLARGVFSHPLSLDLGELGRASGPATALVLLLLMTLLSWRSAVDFGRRAHGTISDGLGIPR